jgi:hypothetical protein
MSNIFKFKKMALLKPPLRHVENITLPLGLCSLRDLTYSRPNRPLEKGFELYIKDSGTIRAAFVSMREDEPKQWRVHCIRTDMDNILVEDVWLRISSCYPTSFEGNPEAIALWRMSFTQALNNKMGL